MGIKNRDGALFMATGIDNSGLYEGKREAMGIIKTLASEITSFDVFGGIGISAATAFAQAAKSSYDFEKEFRKNMLEVATISTQVTDDMTGFMNQVMSITQEIPIKAPEAAKALYSIVSAGHDGADGMKILEVSAKAAVGGLTETETAADAVTTILNAYKMSAEEAGTVSDQLFTTVRLGKTTFGELGASIAQVAPIAAAYGISIDQVLGAVASLTKQGTPTAQAMTQIRAAIQGTAGELGDAAFQGRTFQEALQLINEKAGGSASKMKEMLGTDEGLAATLALTGKNAKSAASDLGELQNSLGATEAAFEKMADEAGNQMTLLSNNIQAALRPMGEVILKNISEAAKTINQGFETGNIKGNIENLEKLLLGVSGAYLAYKSSAIGATAAEMALSAKIAISNSLRSIQNKLTGESVLAKEKERTYQEAYNLSLQKTITEEQRAKLSKLNLVAGSEEYVKAIAAQAIQEKKTADRLVESLTRQAKANREKLASAQESLEMSKKAVQVAKEEFNAAFEANDLAALEVAQTKLNTTAKREEAAATNLSATAKKLRSVESKLAVAVTNQEIAATRLNTATTAADTAVANVAISAKNRLKLATIALWKVMKANPLGTILTAVGLATTAYAMLADKIRETETAQDRLNKLRKGTIDYMADEKAELELLLSIAKDESIIKEKRKEAIERLNEISPEYLGNLSLENIQTKEVTDSIEAYTKALEKSAKMKASQDMVSDRYKKINELNIAIDEMQKRYDEAISGSESKHLFERKLFDLKNEKANIEEEIEEILSFVKEQVEDNPVTIPIKKESVLSGITEKDKKELEKQKKLQEKLRGELLSLRRQNQQSEIDQMKEGSDKKIAQLNLDYDRELDTIRAREKEWREAQGGKLTKEQTIEIRMAKVNAGAKLGNATSDIIHEQIEAEKRAMNEYLKEYGSYLEKRQAIMELYNEKIAKATTEGERLALAEGMKKELADVDNEAQKSTSIITRLFDDMSKKNITSIRAIADEAEKFLSFLERGEYSSDNSFGITKEQFDVLRKSPDQLKAIKDEIANVRHEADQMETSFNKVSNGLKKVFISESDARKLKEGLAEIEEGMSEIMQTGQFLSDTFSKLGDSFGGVFGGIAEGFSVAMDTVSSAMNGAKAGSMFGPLGASAGAAIGVVTSLAGAIAKIHDKKNEKRIQRLQDQIDTLDKSYGKLEKSIEKAYSKDASKMIEQNNKLLEQQKILIQQQIREEQDKKKTDDSRIKEWQEQIEEINDVIAENKEKAKDAIFGEDLKSAIDNFANAQAEAWASGEDRAESAKDTVKKMMRQMVTESIKAATESSGAMEKIRDKLKEFYADNVLSGWEQDYIYNMAEELQKEIDRQFGWADSLMKDKVEEPEKEEDISENTLKGAYAKASQESIDLLAGQTGAVRILLEDIRGGMQPIREQMRLIYDMQSRGWEDVKAIRELSDKVEKNTDRIAENTREIKEVAGKISENTRGTVDALEGTINVKVKM